jgi:hypothetical protein
MSLSLLCSFFIPISFILNNDIDSLFSKCSLTEMKKNEEKEEKKVEEKDEEKEEEVEKEEEKEEEKGVEKEQ